MAEWRDRWNSPLFWVLALIIGLGLVSFWCAARWDEMHAPVYQSPWGALEPNAPLPPGAPGGAP